MSDFYGFEKVFLLESYEKGLDEFPLQLMEKLSDTFFIRLEYIREGIKPIFQNFDIINGTEDCNYFLEQGFNAYFLCSPNFKQNGHAYLVFWKEEQGYWRMISSNTVGGFYSSGGGAQNIYNLIEALLVLNLDINGYNWQKVSFLDVTSDEWYGLEKGCWYKGKGVRGYSGKANYEARDIFERWFKNVQQIRQRQENWEVLSFYGAEKARQVAQERGFDWNTMTDEEREAFIDDVVHEN